MSAPILEPPREGYGGTERGKEGYGGEREGMGDKEGGRTERGERDQSQNQVFLVCARMRTGMCEMHTACTHILRNHL